MVEQEINLSEGDIPSIKKLVNLSRLANKCKGKVRLTARGATVDAKSILLVMSLNLKQQRIPIKIQVDGGKNEENDLKTLAECICPAVVEE